MRRRNGSPHRHPRRPRRPTLAPRLLRRPATGGAVARFATLAGFYGEDPRRAASREVDVGLWWREAPGGPLHRAAWVAATGELYAVRLGPASDSQPAVELLAVIDDEAAVGEVLDGWRERCGEPHSLAWLRGRAAEAGASTSAGAGASAARLGRVDRGDTRLPADIRRAGVQLLGAH